jgi:hypothetical protein
LKLLLKISFRFDQLLILRRFSTLQVDAAHAAKRASSPPMRMQELGKVANLSTEMACLMEHTLSIEEAILIPAIVETVSERDQVSDAYIHTIQLHLVRCITLLLLYINTNFDPFSFTLISNPRKRSIQKS